MRGKELLHTQFANSIRTNKMIVHCPFCNQEYELEDIVEDAEYECGQCHQKFTPKADVIGSSDKDFSTNNDSPVHSGIASQPEARHSNLFACPDCGRQISIYARTCPGCGHPFDTTPSNPSSPSLSTPQEASSQASSPKVQTIEKTSKTWKGLMLFGGLLMLIGLGSCFVDPGGSTQGGFVLFIAGFVITVVAKTGAWWDNG